jgi:hypothetical protein
MSTFTKRAGLVGATAAASTLLVAGIAAPAFATEGGHGHSDSSYSSYDLTKKSSEDNDTTVTRILDDLTGFTARDNDRNGVLNGDDHIGNISDVVDGGIGNVDDVANGGDISDSGNISDVGNMSDVANGDVASGNLNGDNFNGNDVLNGNDTLNGIEAGNTGDIASGDVSTGDIASGNETNVGNGDVNVLNDAEVLNDTLDVVDNTVSGTLDDVLSGGDEGSQWGGGDWKKW